MLRTATQTLSGFNLYPMTQCVTGRPERYSQLTAFLSTTEKLIPRGCGASYGDAALASHGAVLLMERLNRLLAFDEQAGVLTAEAGVTLAEILSICVPRGWFLPVTPGTQYVTLGGCVASDVHGKNHQHNTFGYWVKALEIILANGDQVWCSATLNSELFYATLGGMGLTGIIGSVTLQLIPIESAYLSVNYQVTDNLAAALQALQQAEGQHQYSVAWLNITSIQKPIRGVVQTAQHLPANALPRQLLSSTREAGQFKLPSKLPIKFLTSGLVRLHNALYLYRHSKLHTAQIRHYQEFFYPLDKLRNWPCLYGKAGFLQYHCSMPEQAAELVIAALLQRLEKANCPVYLVVLKRMQEPGLGLLSFVSPGYTLALDLPWQKNLPDVLTQLDEIVIENGGRVYLAKDARMVPENFRKMYKNYPAWFAIKQQYDPAMHFMSDLAERLQMDRL